MEKMKILNYKNTVFETDIDLDEIKEVEVEVVTGDEIITVYLKNGSVEQIDVDSVTSGSRGMDYYDDYYVIKGRKKLEEWNKRTDTYHHFWKDVIGIIKEEE